MSNYVNMESNYITYCLNKYNLYNYFQDSSVNDTLLELLNEIILLYNNIIENNILQIMYYDIYDILINNTYEILYTKYIESKLLENIINYNNNDCNYILYNCIKVIQNYTFKFVIPKRSYNKTFIRKNNICQLKLTNKIEYLKSIIQPEQRSDEWYIFRNSTLTASNIYKIFVSESSQSQLILEKCEPLNINKFKVTNTNSPLHWGQKYEPLSILYYEYVNNTKVTDFGCIPHKEYSFIAASPDGIICDSSSKLYGRMLEIKNVVSREITGIPKMEYWIQMQIQMEVCDLNECDFLETKFVEYTNEEEYINDNNNYKGCFLQFVNNNNEPCYKYPPFDLSNIYSNEFINWKNNELKSDNLIFVKPIFWKLQVISCVLVMRNKLWFNNILPLIETFWNNLLYERRTEKYKERIKKKRKYELDEYKEKFNLSPSGCLLNINKPINKPEPSNNSVIEEPLELGSIKNKIFNIETQIIK
tara:strand:+ start:44 stop:1468 length:1425 start_codon:yes stop_codon:yes gene_type:complete